MTRVRWWLPAPPAPDLVIAQAHVLFALLQGAFDPVALALQERQSGRWCVRRRVAEAVFDLGRVVELPAHDQVPSPGLSFFAIPQPHPLVQNVHPQRAFRSLAQGDRLPGRGGLLPSPVVDPHRQGLRLKAGRGTTAGGLGRRDERRRIVPVNPLIPMDIPDKDLPGGVEGAQEGRIAAVEAVKAHPRQADALLPGAGDHRQGQVDFALEAAVGLGNARRLAARRVARPRFRQKQPFVDQGRLGSPAQRGKHPDLTVFDFAQRAAPLPGDPHRVGSLLGDAAFIDQQGAVGMAAQQPVRVLGHPIQYRPLGPGRFAQHVGQGLMVRLGNRLFHPFHVLGVRLEQAAHGVSRRGLDGPRSLAEMTAEALAEVQESLADAGQQPHLGVSRRVFLTLPTVPLAYVTSPNFVC